ncbi:MAG: UvrD-helicase domain-containing protein [Trueperaceae bacterium]
MTSGGASEPVRVLHDRQARETALTDRRHGLIVEAGAGSGKTAILAGRVALLLADGVRPDAIAAITFTELAAAELAARVREYVELLAYGEVPQTLEVAFPDGEPSEQQRNALVAALEHLDELTCSTIHGFARELVRPYPVEADLDPGATVLDGTGQKLVMADVFELWIREKLGAPSGPGADTQTEPPADHNQLSAVARLVLAEGGVNRKVLEDLAGTLSQWPQAEVHAPSTLEEVLARAQAAANDLLAVVRTTPGAEEAVGDRLDQLPDFMRTLEELPGGLDGATAVIKLERPAPLFIKAGTLSAFQVKGTWRKAAAAAGLSKAEVEATLDEALDHHRRLAEALAELGSAAVDALLAALVDELKEVGVRYRQYKRTAAMLDFDDLIDTALALLRNHPEVRSELAARYSNVLIDEFQDTDPKQAEIVWRLTGVPTEGDWRDWPSRTAARFVVGDPKQSIYRFRGADAATYAHLVSSLEADPHSLSLELNTNFRSRPEIINTVNSTFHEPLSGAEQPGYRPLLPWFEAGTRPSVQRLLVPEPEVEDKLHAGDLRHAEAVAVAALVLDLVNGQSGLLDRPVEPGEIALLAPVGSSLEIYERALDAAGLNVASQAGKGFYRRQEVQDLVALTRALAEPLDRLALGALLKGPLVGATDEELLDATECLKDAAPQERYLNVLTDPAALPEGPIRRTLERLRPLVLRRFATTPHALLWRAIDALEVRAVLLSRHGSHADRALANVDRYLEHSRAFDVRGLKEFAQQVSAAWRNGDSELEGRTDSAAESVTLITIHSAKGLEWPVVIPVNTTSAPKGAQGVLYDRNRNVIATKLFGISCSSYGAVKEVEDAATGAERLRLWYVAATRARELLVVPHHQAATANGAWCNMIGWEWEELPAVEAAGSATRYEGQTQPVDTAQTRALFEEQQRAIEAGMASIERRAPSRRDEQAPSTLEQAEEGEQGPALLTEPELARIVATLDDEVEPLDDSGVRNLGAARGKLLHKLMEELITGDAAAQAASLSARATQLAEQLGLADVDYDAGEMASTALRAWNLPEITALHGRLLAEAEVAGVEQDPGSPGASVYWSGIADAVAFTADGAPEVVIDWKSDVNPHPATLEHYREQLRAYLRLTGAREGLLVLASPGTVISVTAQ